MSQPNIEVVALKESKGSYFAFKLLKLIQQKKYDALIHYGICGGQSPEQLTNVYHIERAFLRHRGVIDNQIMVKRGGVVCTQLPSSSIVSKFTIGEHDDSLYDFATLYDIETFRVAQLSAFVGTPICSLKGVSDLNDIACVRQFSDDEEIDFLLHPEKKRSKKQLLLSQLQGRITSCHEKLVGWFESEFTDWYKKQSF